MTDPKTLQNIAEKACQFDRAYFDDDVPPTVDAMLTNHERLPEDRKLITRLRPRYAVALGFFEGYAQAIEELRTNADPEWIFDVARRWADSRAVNPSQAWDEIFAKVPETIPKAHLGSLITHCWNLAITLPRRVGEDVQTNIGIVKKPPPPPPPAAPMPEPTEEISDALAQAAADYANDVCEEVAHPNDIRDVHRTITSQIVGPWSNAVLGFVAGVRWQSARSPMPANEVSNAEREQYEKTIELLNTKIAELESKRVQSQRLDRTDGKGNEKPFPVPGTKWEFGEGLGWTPGELTVDRVQRWYDENIAIVFHDPDGTEIKVDPFWMLNSEECRFVGYAPYADRECIDELMKERSTMREARDRALAKLRAWETRFGETNPRIAAAKLDMTNDDVQAGGPSMSLEEAARRYSGNGYPTIEDIIRAWFGEIKVTTDPVLARSASRVLALFALKRIESNADCVPLSPRSLTFRDESEREFWDEYVLTLSQGGDRSLSDVVRTADEMVDERRARIPAGMHKVAIASETGTRPVILGASLPNEPDDALFTEAARFANEKLNRTESSYDVEDARSAFGNADSLWDHFVCGYVAGALRKAHKS